MKQQLNGLKQQLIKKSGLSVAIQSAIREGEIIAARKLVKLL